ncbi:uncharacterized protein [Watersipora subatra]|uniref:uncharacterized protein n=1 Tax=Watersipora subatra TaxID=2589382 RepID=UPI00355B9B17
MTSFSQEISSLNPNSSELQCCTCFNDVNLKISDCKHEICHPCLERLRLEEREPPCPVCRTPLTFSAESEQHSKRRGTYDLCEMKDCGRYVDFMCTRCDHFLCYRCNKSSKCGESSSHMGVDVEQDLLPLARQKISEWQSSKEKGIDNLRSEISKKAMELSELTKASENFSRDRAKETSNLIQKLHSLSEQTTMEHDTLYLYHDLEKIKECDLIHFMQRIKKTSFGSKDMQNQTLKTIELDDLKKISKKSLESDEKPKEDDLEAGAKPKLPRVIEGSGSDKQLEWATNYSSPRGYLPQIVLVHERVGLQQCRFTCISNSLKVSGGMGRVIIPICTWTMQCYCMRDDSVTEKHYSRTCRWTKIVDQQSGTMYFVRRCRCIKPPQA